MPYRPEGAAGVADRDLSDATVLVTGSTDGVGREAAIAFARLGATVLVHGRSREKARAVMDRIEGDGGTAETYLADFASLDGVEELAGAVREDHDRLDVLAHNAGTYFREPIRTDDGVEATMGVNHLAPFLLTHRLLPVIPDDGRIVVTASEAHRGASLDPDRIDDLRNYRGFAAYARSKLANVLFTRELARRLDDRTANCFHPGFIPGSALWRGSPLYVRGAMEVLGALPDPVTRAFADTPASGARTLLYLAASPEVESESGGYYADCEPESPSETARDGDLARRLWTVSEEFAGIEDGLDGAR